MARPRHILSHLAHRNKNVAFPEVSSHQSAAPLTRWIMALICHRPHLFWLTFSADGMAKGAWGSAVATLFSHTAGGRRAASPESNLDNLRPSALTKRQRGKKTWRIFSNLTIAACLMLFVVFKKKGGWGVWVGFC